MNVCWWIRNVTDIGIEESGRDDGALRDTKMNGILGGYLVFVSGVGLSASQVSLATLLPNICGNDSVLGLASRGAR